MWICHRLLERAILLILLLIWLVNDTQLNLLSQLSIAREFVYIYKPVNKVRNRIALIYGSSRAIGFYIKTRGKSRLLRSNKQIPKSILTDLIYLLKHLSRCNRLTLAYLCSTSVAVNLFFTSKHHRDISFVGHVIDFCIWMRFTIQLVYRKHIIFQVRYSY